MLSTEDFTRAAYTVHGDKYDYSHVMYVGSTTPVTIICREHGAFQQIPTVHTFNGSGCPTCGNYGKGAYHKKDTNWFAHKAQLIHGDKYDYVKVNYKRYHDKVEIICNEHGSFFQTAAAHISQKQGCPTCSKKNYEGGYGVKRFTTFPELKDKQGILYLVECNNATERFTKVGITQFSVKKRFTGQMPYIVKTITTVVGTMWELFQLEQQVKRAFKVYKYRPNVRFSGHTECFELNQQQQIQTFITEKSIFK